MGNTIDEMLAEKKKAQRLTCLSGFATLKYQNISKEMREGNILYLDEGIEFAASGKGKIKKEMVKVDRYERIPLHVEVGPYEIGVCTRRWREYYRDSRDHLQYDLSPVHFAVEDQFNHALILIANQRQIQVYIYRNEDDRRYFRQYQELYISATLGREVQDWLDFYFRSGFDDSKPIEGIRFSTVLLKYPLADRSKLEVTED